MNRILWLALLALVAVGMLGLSGGGATAGVGEGSLRYGVIAHLAKAPQPQAEDSAQGEIVALGGGDGIILDRSFTYQGRLTNNGNPVNGQYDFRFSLFDAVTGGNQIGTPVTRGSQTVTNGLFTVVVDLGQFSFWGDASWLQIEVRPIETPSFTMLSPRQAVTAAPYATGLRPPTLISVSLPSPLIAMMNTSKDGDGISINAGNNALVANGGIFGVNASGNDAGVYATGNSVGVRAYGDGTGVHGESTTGNGVSGSSFDGIGVAAFSNTNFAMSSLGHARQDRNAGGWVKATARMGFGSITRCYNSQQATPNTIAPCGFSITGSSGDYTIDFGFRVDDRFVSVTPEYSNPGAVIPTIYFPSANQVRVRTYSGGTALIDSAFFLIIH